MASCRQKPADDPTEASLAAWRPSRPASSVLSPRTRDVELAEDLASDLDGQVDYIEDDVLRLIFLSCHPSLTAESQALSVFTASV